jgi:YVTN family beta-propeller protein
MAFVSATIILMLVSTACATPFAYITNAMDNTVSVIDTTTNTAYDNVTVGTNPIAFGQFIGTLLVFSVTNFSTNVTSGYAPLTVQFTDLSTNAIVWNWDFGDEANSIQQNPTHTFAAGNYTVNETVSNTNGINSMIYQISAQHTTLTII